MVEPPPPPLQPSPPLPQAPPTPSVMWGPLPWVAAGGWTKPQCARPRARGTTAALWVTAGETWAQGKASLGKFCLGSELNEG